MKAGPCFLTLAFLLAACSVPESEGPAREGKIPFETILQGGSFFKTDPDPSELTGIEGLPYDHSKLFPAPEHVVLRSDAGQRRFLKEHQRITFYRNGEKQKSYPKLPEADYSENMVVGVMLRRRIAPTTVSIDSLKAQDGRIVAYATEHFSAFSEGTENPVHFVKMAKQKQPVTLAPVDSVKRSLLQE